MSGNLVSNRVLVMSNFDNLIRGISSSIYRKYPYLCYDDILQDAACELLSLIQAGAFDGDLDKPLAYAFVSGYNRTMSRINSIVSANKRIGYVSFLEVGDKEVNYHSRVYFNRDIEDIDNDDFVKHLFSILDDEERKIATMILDGKSIAVIARELGISRSTIYRRLCEISRIVSAVSSD